MSKARISFSKQHYDAVVSRPALANTWFPIAERVRAREVLIASDVFLDAHIEKYGVLRGVEFGGEGKVYLRRMAEFVNAKCPETCVTQGVQNGVSKAFGEGIPAWECTEAHSQACGVKSLRTVSRREWIRDLPHDVNVRLGQLDLLQIIKDSIDYTSNERPGPSPVFEVAEILATDFGQPEAVPQPPPPPPEIRVMGNWRAE